MNKKIVKLLEEAELEPCEEGMYLVQGGNDYPELERFQNFVNLFLDEVMKIAVDQFFLDAGKIKALEKYRC